MQTKNLTKSFGVRVPLDLYMQILKVSTENKITVTDLVLYSIMNSSIVDGKIDFDSYKNGGQARKQIDTLINQNNSLRNQIEEQIVMHTEAVEILKAEHKKTILDWRDIVKENHQEIRELQSKINSK